MDDSRARLIGEELARVRAECDRLGLLLAARDQLAWPAELLALALGSLNRARAKLGSVADMLATSASEPERPRGPTPELARELFAALAPEAQAERVRRAVARAARGHKFSEGPGRRQRPKKYS